MKKPNKYANTDANKKTTTATGNSDAKATFATRESVMKLLSDDEVAKVSNAEAGASLAEGDEYLDLAELKAGVRKAVGKATPVGTLLPRKSLGDSTWTKILAHLPSSSTTAPATP